jgi:predicted Zn-dependent protease
MRSAVISILLLTAAPVLAENPAAPSQRNVGNYLDQALLANSLLLVNPAVESRIVAVTQRLTAASKQPDLACTVRIFNAPDIQITSGPGGFYYVTTGLLDQLQNEPQLASLLAIQVAQVAANQYTERLQQAVDARNAGQAANTGVSLALLGLGFVSGVYIPPTFGATNAIGGAIQNVAVLQYTREQIFDADKTAVHLLQTAGYDPHALIDTFHLLDTLRTQQQTITKKSPAGLLSGDPPFAERIAHVQSLLAGGHP